MDDKQIRLSIVEALIAVAPRSEIQDPAVLVKKAAVIERYVTGIKRGNQSNKS